MQANDFDVLLDFNPARKIAAHGTMQVGGADDHQHALGLRGRQEHRRLAQPSCPRRRRSRSSRRKTVGFHLGRGVVHPRSIELFPPLRVQPDGNAAPVAMSTQRAWSSSPPSSSSIRRGGHDASKRRAVTCAGVEKHAPKRLACRKARLASSPPADARGESPRSFRSATTRPRLPARREAFQHRRGKPLARGVHGRPQARRA